MVDDNAKLDMLVGRDDFLMRKMYGWRMLLKGCVAWGAWGARART